jgi:hypothetical protein
MAVVLPTSLPAAAGWALADWLPLQVQSKPAADGVATIEFPQLDPDEQWLIDRLVVTCTSTTATVLRLYDSVVTLGRLLDTTSSGNLNTADYPAGLLVRPASVLIAQWTGASPAAVGAVTLQARVMRRLG